MAEALGADLTLALALAAEAEALGFGASFGFGLQPEAFRTCLREEKATMIVTYLIVGGWFGLVISNSRSP